MHWNRGPLRTRVCFVYRCSVHPSALHVLVFGSRLRSERKLPCPSAHASSSARVDAAPRTGGGTRWLQEQQHRDAVPRPSEPLRQRSSELEYINKYRQLEAQELDVCGSDRSAHGPGPRPPSAKLSHVPCIPETTYKYPDLPINRCREEVISLVESNSVVIIHGATGSGKSTQLPQYILEHHIQRSSYCNIVVTQPRKIGASSIARWISRERAWALGGLVGYQVGLEKIATEDTKLVYMTTGVLLQKIVSAKSLMEFTHIFIDEPPQERRFGKLCFLKKGSRWPENRICGRSRCAWAPCLPGGARLRVLISAVERPTVRQRDALAILSRDLVVDGCGLRESGGREMPWCRSRQISVVDGTVVLMSATINCKEFADYFAVPVQNKMKPAHIFEVEGQPHSIEECYLGDLEHIHHGRLSPHLLEEPVITKDIYEVAVSLIQMFDDLDMKESGNKNWSGAQFVSERSSVLVFLPGLAEINCMHELLTNMVHKRLQVYPLHSSVTLEEQSSVLLSPVPGYRKIILSTNIAESSVTVPDVKYGRAGRVSKGYCYRLVHRDFWDSAIPDHVIPEMLRCPLGSTVLKVKLLDMGEPRALLATALSPPSLSDIERTVLLLKEVGALAVSGQREDENPHDGELTFLGRVLAQLPVSQQLGKLIVLGHVFGCLDECLIIAAALSLKNFFAMPFRQHLDGYRNKVNFSSNSKSDCIALVEAFKVAELYEELKGRISQFNMCVDSRRPVVDQEHTYKQRFILQVVLAGAFYPNYFTFGQPDEEMAVRELAGKDPKTTVVLKHIPPYGFLYYKQLQSLFRQCGQVKSIVFDGAKVNVDFQKQTVDPVQVSLSTLHRSRAVTELLLTVDVTEALEFKICKMRPSARSLVCGEHWSGGASRRFAALVSGCALLVKVFSVVHSVLHVDVYRCSGVQDLLSVRDVLIDEGYAELADECYESKQSHEVLKGLFSKSVENVTDMSVASPGKDEEKHLIRILLDGFSSRKFGAPNCKVILHGPFNPYELKCHSLTRISKFRCVWIEKESINSVIISDSPEDLHQRMLVAASLSVNATGGSAIRRAVPNMAFLGLLAGSTMLLRETSLMPPVPGLPALLSMLFAPVMELRVDRAGKSYTGVLCGLGWNPTTGAPILPEHDIELAFDVQFSVEDIVEINILRAAVNKLVCDGPNGLKFLGPERIAQLQDNSRQKLLGLFCQLKPRERIVPKWHEKPYEWDQVDPKLVMEQADPEGGSGKSTLLYQLHRLIVLSP
ncbi:Putative ATP-dependent RNA helicase TDRD9 [Pteropus alecto]|uniref:Putative ATP-dependent RNA helicase TDRD9 n=1 Tax=Pteropus alecto TaxID=9402 RepID=L5JPG3_PTEAL|nr:Putative ATP-dependent RNA helicase TDRD9 [Pteropus alecto]